MKTRLWTGGGVADPAPPPGHRGRALGTPAEFDRLDEHYWHGSHEIALSLVRKHVGRGARILDLCCGTGLNARPLADDGYKLHLYDIDPGLLREAMRQVPEAEATLGDAGAEGNLPPCDVLLFTNASGYFTLPTIESILRRARAPLVVMNMILEEDQALRTSTVPAVKNGRIWTYELDGLGPIDLYVYTETEVYGLFQQLGYDIVDVVRYEDHKVERMLVLRRRGAPSW